MEKEKWVTIRVKQSTKDRFDRIMKKMQTKNCSIGLEKILIEWENRKSEGDF